MENENFDILKDIELNSKNEPENTTFLNTKEEKFENIINFDDEQIDEQIFENNYLIEKEEEKIKPIKKNSILSGIIFLFKYCLTSTLIFGILLVSTNYVAYFNIAKSFFNKNEQKLETRGIIDSVEASTIKGKYIEKLSKENLLNEENEGVTQYSLKKLINESNKKFVSQDIDITPYDNRIVIPKIGKNIPLVDLKNKKIEGGFKEVNNIFMKELENGVIRYPGSAKPGEEGNTFVFGHSSNFPWIKGEYNEVFALLDDVEYNDEIYIYYGQKKYKYIIREKKVISPGDVSILKRDKDKSELTLMTCWPIGTTLNRLIVTGELVE